MKGSGVSVAFDNNRTVVSHTYNTRQITPRPSTYGTRRKTALLPPGAPLRRGGVFALRPGGPSLGGG